ncbi:MAG: hypothetical protein GY853_13585 [PVC group bacterium]|nr:hypothetical protein [PVC group bacterium]
MTAVNLKKAGVWRFDSARPHQNAHYNEDYAMKKYVKGTGSPSLYVSFRTFRKNCRWVDEQEDKLWCQFNTGWGAPMMDVRCSYGKCPVVKRCK